MFLKNNFKNHFVLFLVCLVSLSFSAFSVYSIEPAQGEIRTIGISQIVEHPALDAARAGILQGLKDSGYVEGKNLKVLYENAQGNIVTSTQIALKLLSEPLDLAIGISTPSAQSLFFAAQKQPKQLPIVFSVVSDPKLSKLDQSSGYPITGVTDAVPLEPTLDLIQKMMPNIKRLGILYNPAEANSVSTITQFKKLLKNQDISIIEVNINKTSEAVQATKSLKGKVDALYLPQDNTVVSAIDVVTAELNNIPIFCSDPLLINKGVTAAMGFDYFDIGHETGLIAAKILSGEKAESISIITPSKLQTKVNSKMVEKFGLKNPTRNPP